MADDEPVMTARHRTRRASRDFRVHPPTLGYTIDLPNGACDALAPGFVAGPDLQPGRTRFSSRRGRDDANTCARARCLFHVSIF